MEDAENRIHLPCSSSSKKARKTTATTEKMSSPPDPLPLTRKRAPLGELTNITSSERVQKRKLSHGDTDFPPPPPPPPPSPPPCDVPEAIVIDDDDHQYSDLDYQIEDYLNQMNQIEPEPEPESETPASSSVDSTDGFEVKKCSYSSSIYEHLRSLEVEANKRPLADYMETVQKDVRMTMREILIDWLAEVTQEYKLVADTFYLSVSYIDRYLSSNCISKSKLQLLGVSCMSIASKYEEIDPPHAEKFCYITDNAFSKEEVLDMETDVLKFLNNDMSAPTAKKFLRILTRVAQNNATDHKRQFEYLSSYLCELSLLEYGCLRFLPSEIAASCVFLSRFIIFPDEHPWITPLQLKSGYRAADLKDCVLVIHELAINKKESTLRGIRDNFSNYKHMRVSTMELPSEIPLALFSCSEGCGNQVCT